MSDIVQTHALSGAVAGRRADNSVGMLIARCLNGDERAFALIYDQFSVDIYRLCFSLLQHREDAEEVLQDSFEYAFRRLQLYQPEKAAFRTWLFQIAVSRCRNKRRRKLLPTFSLQQLAGETLADNTALSPQGAAELTNEQQRVMDALHSLSTKLREVTVLRYYQGMTFPEIGAVLGISPKTAESRMRLAHGRLKKQLAPANMDGAE